MKAAFLVVVALGSGLGFLLNTAGCSDACSASAAAGAGGTSCSTGAATGGTGGTSAACPALTAVESCASSFCKADGAGTPFCKCFLRGYDLSPPLTDTNGNETGCACIAIDGPGICSGFPDNGVDAGSVDCSAVSGPWASECVGVQ